MRGDAVWTGCGSWAVSSGVILEPSDWRYVEFIIPGEHGKKVCLRSPFFNSFYGNFF